jgi:hypothetical protein
LPFASLLVNAGPLQAPKAKPLIAMTAVVNSALRRNVASKKCLSPELVD